MFKTLFPRRECNPGVTLALRLPYVTARVTLAYWLLNARDNSPKRDNVPPSCVTSNLDNLN